MNTYRATSDRGVALYGADPVELDLSAVDERDALQGGHLEVVPRPYRVLVNNFAEGKQGDVVDLALVVDNEAALVSGAVLERAEKKPASKSAK